MSIQLVASCKHQQIHSYVRMQLYVDLLNIIGLYICKITLITITIYTLAI